MTKSEIAIFWALSWFAALCVAIGRLGFALYGIKSEQPPEDQAQAANWRRRRRWLAVSELSALPAFATLAIAVTVYFKLEPVSSVLMSMGLGGLGFGFLLNGLKYIASRRMKALGQ